MEEITDKLDKEKLRAYFKHLVNKTYKILPLKESAIKSGDSTMLNSYLDGFARELLGCGILFDLIEKEPRIVSVFCIITYLREEKYDKEVCKSEVFRCIGILNKISDKYFKE